MLISLHVKNLALIEESEVYFKEGLNILTGETGAGKSIIIGSIHLALGAKIPKDCIRTGAEYALVELIFSSDKSDVVQKMKEMDIPTEEDGTIVIARKIMPGRSVCKINGETIGSRQLKEIASLLIDIHGQNDTQTLLNVKKYSEILDDYAGDELTKVKTKYCENYEQYCTLLKELEELKNQDENKEKELSLFQFELEEITQAKLQSGEDEILEEKYKKMNNSKRIAQTIGKVCQAVGYECEGSASEQLSASLREIKGIVTYDSNLAELEEELTQIDNLVSDFNRHISSYSADLEFEPEEYIEVENRLNLCNHLKSKYGTTIEEVLAYGDELEQKIQKLSDLQSYLADLLGQIEHTKNQLIELALSLSEIRKKAAQSLSISLTKNLVDLNFQKVDFQVLVDADKEKLTREGIDTIDFLVSFNPGEPIKSLSQVASGGELSRFMLALKTIMADKEKTQTLIFDEIDAGISGKTAWNVSEKMAVLGRQHQLICITHLPQIAAMADCHFVISKDSVNNVTTTKIEQVDQEESLGEIARLLGTSVITPAVMANAAELKEMANHTKRY